MTDTQKVSIETVARNIEAVMMVMDEPMSVVALAGALEVPVGSVNAALESLVADYDGQSGGVERGFELREVGGGWRFYVRATYDEVVTRAVSSHCLLYTSPSPRDS